MDFVIALLHRSGANFSLLPLAMGVQSRSPYHEVAAFFFNSVPVPGPKEL